MSNPGVLTLAEKKISETKRFKVEDNLGESVHIHYNDIRIDLTIKELLSVAGVCEHTIYELIQADGFNLDDYSGEFLNACSEKLIDLIEVEKTEVQANQLFIIQQNKLGIPMKKQINSIKCSKKRSVDEQYMPVLFNDDNVVQFGEEVLRELLQNDVDAMANVIRMKFRDDKFSASNNPTLDYFFKWNMPRIKIALKNIAKKVSK